MCRLQYVEQTRYPLRASLYDELYVWNAFYATHMEIAARLRLPRTELLAYLEIEPLSKHYYRVQHFGNNVTIKYLDDLGYRYVSF